MGDLSPNFSRREFRCKDGCGGDRVDEFLVTVLQRIRNAIGGPLPIVSGYRCRAHNKRVGGSTFSQHMYGRAADLPGGWVTIKQAHAAGAVGVGLRSGRVVHVDVRRGRRPFTFLD